ncbi:MAG: M24 family metallopeptidase, partial [Candidatus Aenigmarchaeota archaeon]|nr:M24 family metallopeptidase [Candidatus Aenigmarchaeota archaeon]
TAQRELPGVQIYQYEDLLGFLPTLANLLKDYQVIGLNYNGIPHAGYLALKTLVTQHPASHELVDLSAELTAARLIKTKAEIEKIRNACEISSHVTNEIPTYDHTDEKTVAAQIEFNMRKQGGTAQAFSTIVAIGPNSAYPHYTTGDRPAKSGELLLTDFGAEYVRYKADITRTFIYEHTDAKAQHLYEVVLQAQREALDSIYAGVAAKDVDAVARNIINNQYPDRFTHGLGHGLGLELGEGGSLSPSSDLLLEEGMVFTIEPGIYLRDYGGVRIEDDVVVTKDGVELLTSAKKEEL